VDAQTASAGIVIANFMSHETHIQIRYTRDRGLCHSSCGSFRAGSEGPREGG
jgi:hypothetical protein